MDEVARLKLNQMIEANGVTDQTDLIRELKHSDIIRKETDTMLLLMKEYSELEYSDLRNLTMVECNFLFSYYTDIYNRILKRELNMDILYAFLNVLAKIECGELSQHDGSYLVGKLLKQMYIDSALKKSEQLDRDREASEPIAPVRPETLAITWKQFKTQQTCKYVL
jgi:hypothetical protein